MPPARQERLLPSRACIAARIRAPVSLSWTCQNMGVDDAQDGSDGGVRERRPIHSAQAKERPQPEEGRVVSPFTYQQQWLAEAELLTDEQGYSDFIPDQQSEYGDLDSARSSQPDSLARSSGSWRGSGKFLRTNSLNGKDQNKPHWRQRLQSTLSPRNSATTAKRAAPPSQVGGEAGEVAAQLTALTSKIAELQAEVARLQNEPSGTSRPASPSTKADAPLAQSTASHHPQPEAPRNRRATPPKQPAVPPAKTPEGAAATSAYQSHDNLMTRTPSEFVNGRSNCLPPQRTKEPAVEDGKKQTAVSIVMTAARLLTERGGEGLYWAIARLGDGVGLVSRAAQYSYATGAGNDIEGEEPIAIEYEEWELVNGKPTLAARRWREEHGPVVPRRKGQGHLCIAPRAKSAVLTRGGDETVEWEPWELVNGKPTLAALRMREEQGPAVVRQERVTPMRPALEAHGTRISPPRPSPLPTTARAVGTAGDTPKVPAQHLRAISPTQQPVSAIWIDAVVSPSTSSHSASSAGAAAPKPSNASRPASPSLKAPSSQSAV